MSARESAVAADRPDRVTRALVRALAARCRGRTAVLGGDEQLVAALRARGLAVQRFELGAAGFRTVVVARLLEYLAEEAGAEALGRAWAAVEPGGRLIVVVPNEDCGAEPAQRCRFKAKTLKRMLRPLGRPKLAADQPYRWLTMYVERPRGSAAGPSRAERARFRATARLCRGRVLELGCGEGRLARVIRDRGLEVVGVDLSAAKIERARERHPNIQFVRSDIRALALPDASFDTVVLAEVLEHVPDEPGAEILERAWRLLRPGGRLVASVPNEDLIPHPNHVRRFDRRGLKALLAPLGRPRLVTEQPFKWLMMYVEKRA